LRGLPDSQSLRQEEMKKYLIVRTPSGISGDMLVAGLAKVSSISDAQLQSLVDKIGLVEMKNPLKIRKVSLDGIAGWRAFVRLKECHHHRNFGQIRKIIRKSRLSPRAKRWATQAFRLLAQAEGEVHRIAPEKVTFHEVGALDSILDVCLAAALYDEMELDGFYCSPLPLCDGVIRCAHGVLPAPAPATLYLLKNVPVYGVDSKGETVTPTAVSILKALDVKFGTWPAVTLKKMTRIYGGRILPNIPNGAVFALGFASALMPRK
jgi:uncharacterized protein (DUF111 family)